jgi:hypothetical protein
MKNCNSSNMDGSIEDMASLDGTIQTYDIMYGNQAVSRNFYCADGSSDEYHNAKGKRRKKRRRFGSGTILDKDERARRRSLREDTKAQRNERRNLGAQARADAKAGRTQTKMTQADTQKMALEKLGQETESDKVMNAQLSTPGVSDSATPTKPGMSKGLKIGIAIGVVAILGTIAFVVYKKMKASK